MEKNIENQTKSQVNKLKKEKRILKKQEKEMNIKREKTKRIIYYSYLGILTFMLFFWFATYKEIAYYPEWGEGEKVLSTIGNVTNSYIHKETGKVYTQITYTVDNKNYEKWFQVDLKGKETSSIYYVESKPLEKSRITNPVDKEDINNYNIVLTILAIVFVCSILLKNKILKNKSKNY